MAPAGGPGSGTVGVGAVRGDPWRVRFNRAFLVGKDGKKAD
jgi:hypothetical protein